MALSLDQMKAITRRFCVEPWSDGNLDLLDEVCGPEYVLEGNATVQGLKDAITMIRCAVPDLKVEVGTMVAEGDQVAYSWTMKGTHLGPYEGVAPTGKPVIHTGITIVRFAGDKIVEDQFQSSSPSMMAQIS